MYLDIRTFKCGECPDIHIHIPCLNSVIDVVDTEYIPLAITEFKKLYWSAMITGCNKN